MADCRATTSGSTVDAGEVARFSALADHLVGPARQDGRAAQVQPGAARLHQGGGLPAVRPRPQAARQPRGPAHPRHRLRRRHPERAAGAARAPTWSAPTRRPPISRRRGCTPAQSGLAIDYRATTAEALADAGERFDVVLAMEVVEHVADVHAVRRALRRDGEARRADGRRPRSTARSRALRSRSSAPNTCCAGCRAAPISGTSSSRPNELEIALERQRAAGDRRDRRDLQSARRPLAALDRHGRELHGRRRTKAA